MILLNSDNTTGTKLRPRKSRTHSTNQTARPTPTFLYSIAWSLVFPLILFSLTSPSLNHALMASKLLRNPLTEKRNRIKPKDHETDVSAIEKAAAWAWYQRSSGSEGTTMMREFHTTRTHRDIKPSRYRLEAMRMASSQETKEGSFPVHYTKKLPLLDAYEVRSILMRLDSLVEESGHDKLGNGLGTANACLDDNGSRRMRKKKAGKGIWERRGVICSTRKEDVTEGRRGFRESQIQLSPKRIPAANRSVPRANGAL